MNPKIIIIKRVDKIYKNFQTIKRKLTRKSKNKT